MTDDGTGRGVAVVLVAVVLLVAAVAAVATTGTVAQSGTNATATAASGTTVAANATANATPGARLAGAVAVGRVETEATVAAAAFEADFAAAATDAGRADAVVAYLAATNRSLDDIERAAARVARASGAMDAGERRARAAAVAAGARAALRAANRSEAAAASLPAALRRDRAIPDRIETIRRRARAVLAGGGAAGGGAGGTGGAAGGSGGAAGGDGAAATPDPNRTAPIALEDVVAAYEAGTGGVPARFRGLFGSETVEVVVRRADGRTATFTLRTRNGSVVDSERGPADDASLRIRTTHAVVREVRRAEDPWPVLQRALADGRAAYDGVGPANSVKFGAVAILQGVASALGGF